MAKKYNTVNLTDEQLDKLERTVGLLEALKRGPYGGYGGTVSWGKAIEYLCDQTYPELVKHVEAEEKRKRAEAARKRQNNNPNITPGVTRSRADFERMKHEQHLAEERRRFLMDVKVPESKAEASNKPKGLLGRLRIK